MKYLENKYIVFGIIATLVLVIYGQTINYEFILDDSWYITENSVVQNQNLIDAITKSSTFGYDNVNDGSYRPVFMLSLIFDHMLFGNTVEGYRIMHLFLYMALGILFYLILQQFFSSKSKVPLLSTILYLVHPIHTEVVANIKSRDEILASFFLLLSVYFYLKFLKNGKEKKNIGIAIFMFFLSIASKESFLPYFLIFPFLTWTLDEGVKQRGLDGIGFVFILPAVFFLFLRFAFLDELAINNLFTDNVYNNFLAEANSIEESICTRIYLQWMYLKQSLFPNPMLYDYSYGGLELQGYSSLGFYLGLIVLLLYILALVWLFISSKRIFVVLLFFGLGLILVNNLLIDITASFAERFLFSPTLVVCFLLVLGSERVFRNQSFIVIILLVTIGSYVSIARTKAWENDFYLCQTDHLKSPNNFKINLHLGSKYRGKALEFPLGSPNRINNLKKAVKHFELSRKIIDYKDAIYTFRLGSSYHGLGRYNEAISCYNEVIKMNGYNKHEALANLGSIYQSLGSLEKAIESFISALDGQLKKKEVFDAKGRIAKCFLDLKKFEDAIKYSQEVINEGGDNSDLRNNMGVAYFSLQEYQIAYEHFLRSFELNPKNKDAERNIKIVKDYYLK